MQLPERRRAIDREQWEVRRGEIVLERVNHEVGGGGRVQLNRDSWFGARRDGRARSWWLQPIRNRGSEHASKISRLPDGLAE